MLYPMERQDAKDLCSFRWLGSVSPRFIHSRGLIIRQFLLYQKNQCIFIIEIKSRWITTICEIHTHNVTTETRAMSNMTRWVQNYCLLWNSPQMFRDVVIADLLLVTSLRCRIPCVLNRCELLFKIHIYWVIFAASDSRKTKFQVNPTLIFLFHLQQHR